MPAIRGRTTSVDFGMRQRILVMRHPETPANTEHFFSGRRDVPLTSRGERQRERGVDALVAFGPERIWCSPLSRCRNLAEEAGERLGIPVRVDDDLVELDFGELEGTRFEASNSGPTQFPWPLDEYGHSLPAPGAESFEHATARANHLMDELRPLAGRTALVTHGGFSRILIAAMYDVPYDRFWNVHLANVCSAYYTCNGKSFYLGGFNLTPDEVIERSTKPNPYDLRDIWGVSERKDA